jgi:Zinc finger, C3HC4 type (RING finger)
LASLNTPSPRASNVNLLKIKGSLTDPAPTRRRRTLGQVSSLLFLFLFCTQLHW